MQEHSITGDLPPLPTSATTDSPGETAEFAAMAAQKAKEAAEELREARAGTKRRAGFTTRKNRGTPKAQRKLAASSRRRNRGK